MKFSLNKNSWFKFFSLPGLIIPAAVLGLLIAIGLVVSISILSRTQLVLARDEVTVKGLAYQDVVADNGTWKITLSVVRGDRASSLSAMETQQRIVTDYLKKIDSFMTNTSIAKTLEKYEYEDSKRSLKGYSSTISFTVDSNNVDQLYSEATAFNKFAVENNLDVQLSDVNFYYSKLDSLKIDLLKKAVLDAKERAKALGASSDTKVGKVKRAAQGIFQVNERNNFDVSSGGNFDTDSKEKTIQATIDITFELL